MLLLLGIKSFEFDWLRQPEFSSGRAPWPETISIRLYAHEISPAQHQPSTASAQHEISSAVAAAQKFRFLFHGRSKSCQFSLPAQSLTG